MLSNRVDLTNNRDFGVRPMFDENAGMTGRFLKRARMLANNSLMSIDEYESIVAYEHFFGIIMRDESADLFMHDKESRYMESLKGECQRCGKLLSVPWKVFHGLCKECDEGMEKRIPWRNENVRDRNDDNDILYTR